MLTIDVVNTKGERVSSLEVDPEEFGGEVRKQLLHDVVLMHLANRRQGTHKSKPRGEVAGHKKKLFKQKGTGNARAGTRRSNKRVGGGTTKGPRPRDYSYSIPKRARRLATRMAILSRLEDKEAVIVDGLSLAAPKTQQIAAVLQAIGVGSESCLIATMGVDQNVYLSARNIKGMEILPAGELHAYALLRPKRVVFTKDAFEALRQAPRYQGTFSQEEEE
ncbi:50S ribosomal protein L4 [bacterium]|nr:50S ribosomal protein L4 [bacterium]